MTVFKGHWPNLGHPVISALLELLLQRRVSGPVGEIPLTVDSDRASRACRNAAWASCDERCTVLGSSPTSDRWL
jgi:hypothetical protein